MDLPESVNTTLASKTAASTAEQDDLTRRLAQLRQM